jgi:DNA-binding MarR family transcriptional regulator
MSAIDNYTFLKEIFLLLDHGDRYLLQRFNLSTARFNALAHLMNRGELGPSELANLLLCDNANVTRLLDGMQGEGWIVKRRDEDDRRRVIVTLTEKGRLLWQRAREAHLEYTFERTKCLEEDEHVDLQQLLSRLCHSLREDLMKRSETTWEFPTISDCDESR